METPSTATDLDRPAPTDESPPQDHVDDTTGNAGDRVVLGVAGYVADGLGVDALWVRMAFVVLALVGGLGVMAYLAIWLIVFGPARTGLPFVRYIGGAAAVAGIPLVIAGADLGFVSGPIAVVALLVGLMLALWQPRNMPRTGALPASSPLPPPRRAAGSTSDDDSLATERHSDSALDPDPGSGEEPPRRTRRNRNAGRTRRPRREPSILGRLTFALALIVAAVGALIDFVNGGRLHPEQWLGAAALVCGIGLFVGAVRGRAWWLIVPALLFAGTGYISGLMARIGLDAGGGFGDTSAYINESTPGGTRSLHQVVGNLWVSIDGAPVSPITIDARVAIGTLEVNANEDVSVEIRSDSDRGDLIVNGVVVPDGVGHLGPDGPPDVIVDARLGIGDVSAFSYPYDPAGDGNEAQYLLDDAAQVADGVSVTPDGWIVLAYGEALIAPDNSVASGDVVSQGENFAMIATGMGDFVVDNGTLQTPTGQRYELGDLRARFSPGSVAVAPSTTVPTTNLPTTPTTPGG